MKRPLERLLQLARPLVATALVAVTLESVAQPYAPAPPPPPMPPGLEPLPEIVPPPPGVAGDPELEPQVTISKNAKGEIVEEARVNGKLIWIKVTPRHGVSYYLVPDPIDGILVRRDGFDPGLRVPLWVLFSW